MAPVFEMARVFPLPQVFNMTPARPSEGEAFVTGPLVDIINYCSGITFEGFELAESKPMGREGCGGHVSGEEKGGYGDMLVVRRREGMGTCWW